MSNTNFSGQVSDSLDLSEIFKSLARSRQQGTLTIRDRYRRKSIYFEQGQVTLISEPRRIKLGSLLVSTGKLNEDDLELAIKLQKRSNKRLGEILVEEAFCTEVDIQRCVRYQVECEIYDVFLWKAVTYDFAEGPLASELVTNGQVTKIKLDSEALLTEATHRLQEWRESIFPLVPSLREVYVKTDRSAEGLGLPEKFMAVVPLIDGKHSVEDLAGMAQLSDFEVCKHLAKMAKIGAISALSVVDLTSRARESFALQDFETSAKLFARLEEIYPEDLQYQLPLADSLRQAMKKYEALEVYDQIAAQLEAKQIEFDTLKNVYQYIYQIDANRLDALDKLKNLEEQRRQRQAARWRWVPWAFVLFGVIAVTGLWAWILLTYNKQREEFEIRRQEAHKVLLSYEKAKKTKTWADVFENGQTLVKNYAEFAGDKPILLPIQIETRPPGFSVFVNGELIGKTTYEQQKIVGQYDPLKGDVTIEVASSAKKSKIWNEQTLKPFQYHDIYVDIQDRTKFAMSAEGEFQAAPSYAPVVKAFVSSSRDGNVYIVDPASLDSFGQVNSKIVAVGQYGDWISSPAIARSTAIVGNVESEAVAINLDTGQIEQRFKMTAPVVAKPLVNSESVIAADIDGVVRVFDRVGEMRHELRRPTRFKYDGVWAKGQEHALLLGDDGHVIKVESKSGKILQQLDFDSNPASRLVANDFRFGVMNDQGIALVSSSFDLGLGFKEYKGEGEGPFDLALSESMVFVSSRDNIMAYDIHSGAVRWRWRDENPSRGLSRVTLLGDRLVFAQGNEWLRAFSLAEGKLIWRGKLASGQIVSPLCVGDKTVVAGINGISMIGFSPFYELTNAKEGEDESKVGDSKNSDKKIDKSSDETATNNEKTPNKSE